jgi:hypothetical protein
MESRSLLHRDLRSAHHVDLLVVAAVCTVLLVRFYLRLTDYPQVGGEHLHVAHMLWGGLLMLTALLLLLSFLGRRSRLWAALAGGVGFGLFIDEVGKFVTNDNDYFYRPAVALIYVTFVVTYLAARGLRRRRKVTHEETLVNALHDLEEAVLHDFQAEERARVLRELEPLAGRDPLAAELVAVVRRAAIAPGRPPTRLERLRAAAVAGYRRLAAQPGFARALVAFFVAQLVVKLGAVAVLLLRPDAGRPIAARVVLLSWTGDTLALAEWLQIGSSLGSALLVAAGVAALHRSRVLALRLFQRSILVSIFLTQVFMFYREQWAALLVLAFNVVVLLGVDFARAHEAERTA